MTTLEFFLLSLPWVPLTLAWALLLWRGHFLTTAWAFSGASYYWFRLGSPQRWSTKPRNSDLGATSFFQLVPFLLTTTVRAGAWLPPVSRLDVTTITFLSKYLSTAGLPNKYRNIPKSHICTMSLKIKWKARFSFILWNGALLCWGTFRVHWSDAGWLDQVRDDYANGCKIFWIIVVKLAYLKDYLEAHPFH